MSSETDGLIPLTEEQQRQLEESQKNESESTKILREVTTHLDSIDNTQFDKHLFLLLFTLFKEAQGSPRMKDYVAQMPIEDFDRFKSTVIFFHEFLNYFVKVNIRYKQLALGENKLSRLVDLVTEYNNLQDESVYKLPDIETDNPNSSLFEKLKEKLQIGREKNEKK